MSKFVIMETVDGCHQPVAIRESHDVAMVCCVGLANNMRLQEPQGSVQSLEDGARFSVPEVIFTVVEVENVSVDFS